MKRSILVTVLALAATSCGGLREENTILQNRLAQTVAAVDSLEKVTQQLEGNVEELRSYNYWFNPSYDGREMLDAGISDPEGYVTGQLNDRPELIPAEAILGGTMFFWNTQLLGSQWLIADYTDGHVSGRALYRYRLGEDGNIVFSLMDSEIE